jgi:hypothetical protein
MIESERTKAKILAAFEHIAHAAEPIIRDRLEAGRTSDEAAADVLSGMYWLPDRFGQVRQLIADLKKYAEQCDDARYWGGPTIYPHNPINETRAREVAKLLTDLLNFG